jgi:hypothetical protein
MWMKTLKIAIKVRGPPWLVWKTLRGKTQGGVAPKSLRPVCKICSDSEITPVSNRWPPMIRKI